MGEPISWGVSCGKACGELTTITPGVFVLVTQLPVAETNPRTISAFPTYLCLAYIILSLYAFGGGVVEGFVYYPAWKVVGAGEFPAFHRDMSSRLLPSFVAPFFLSVMLNGLLLRLRPAALPLPNVLLVFVLNALILIVTIGWAIPIQMQLSQAQSVEAIDRLIALDRPWRLLPGAVLTAINVGMLFRLVRG